MNETLQRLIEAFASGGADAVRALLADLLDTELAELDAAGVEALQSIGAQASITTEDADAVETIADVVDVVRAEGETRLAAAQATADRVASATQRVLGTTDTADDATDAPTDGDGGGEDDDTDGGATDDATTDEPADDREPVTASAGNGRRPVDPAAVLRRLSGARRTQPEPQVAPQRPAITLVAAAEVPGYSNGSHFEGVAQLAQAAVDKLTGMPRRPTRRGEPVQSGLAIIRKSFPAELTVSSESDHEVIDFAAKQDRLEGGSLVAAGGWCAPSETWYDVFELEGTDGLVSVPEVLLTRGGVRFSAGPDFSTIYTGAGFHQTEAQSIAGDDKTFYSIPCPTFTETRLNAIGVGLTVGILENSAYPEFVQRIIRGAMAAHAHKLNFRSIAGMVSGSTAVAMQTATDDYFTLQGASSGILEALEMQAVDYRYKHRMDDNALLEGVGPRWVRAIIRADLSKRNGQPFEEVTNAQIDAFLLARQIRIQWVYDWQDSMADGGDVGGASALKVWPSTVKFLLYAAGTWVRGMKDVITLNAGVYDHAGLVENTFDTLFTEEGYAMVKRGLDSRAVTIPICANGATGAQAAFDCVAEA